MPEAPDKTNTKTALNMADEPQTLENRSSGDGDPAEGDQLQELEKLEVEVKQMAQTIIGYRTALPDQFKKAFASVLVAQRPVIPHLDRTPEAGTSDGRTPDAGEHIESSKGTLLAEEDPETAKKIRSLKLKISNNVSAMPIILKRMKECICMIDKLDSYNATTHPAFKRKRTS